MRTVSAIDVRKRFGQILDDAGAGERIVIERAGHPVAALVPLSDLSTLDPELTRARRLAALQDLRRMAASSPSRAPLAAVALVRSTREAQDRQMLRGLERARARAQARSTERFGRPKE